MTIVISTVDDEEYLPISGATVRWLTMTPWNGASFKTHVSIPGGNGLGKEYRRGKDNRMATVTGVVKWNKAGQELLDWLGGNDILYVDNGIEQVTCKSDSPMLQEYGGAYIKFTLSLTEVQN